MHILTLIAEPANNGIQDVLNKAVAHVFDHFVVYILAAILIGITGYALHKGLGILNRIFRVVPVSGKWKTAIDRGTGWEDHEEAQLRQLANRVWGATTITAGKGGTYELRGHLNGHMLCLVYRKSRGAGFDAGAIVLEANPEGDSLEGFEVGYDKVSKAISTRKYKWTVR